MIAPPASLAIRPLREKGARVLVIATEAFGGQGGIAQYNRDFVTAVAEIPGVSIDILPRLHRSGETSIPKGVAQHPPVFNRYLYGVTAMTHAVRRRPDVVVNAHLYHSPLSQRIAALVGARLVSILHGTEVWHEVPGSLLRPLSRSDVIAFASDDTRQRLASLMPNVTTTQVATYNTVGEQFQLGDRVAARQKFGVGHEFVIATVGRLDARSGVDGRAGYKGHDRIIRALKNLWCSGRPVTYLVAGEGEDLDRLHSEAEDAGAADRVKFLGRVPDRDLPDLYRAADLFAMPSTGEGFGIVYLEAMACGTPAIGLDVGGAGEALKGLGIAAPLERFEEDLTDAVAYAARLTDDNRAALASSVHERFGRSVYSMRVRNLINPLLRGHGTMAA